MPHIFHCASPPQKKKKFKPIFLGLITIKNRVIKIGAQRQGRNKQDWLRPGSISLDFYAVLCILNANFSN